MDQKVALITGGARGIGKGSALDLATCGWSVAICYRTSEQEAAATTRGISEQGGQGLAVRSDVSDPAACRDLVRQVE